MQVIHPSVFVAPSSEQYGKLEVGEGSSLWPQSVIRSECQYVRIGAKSNLQDFAMIHVGFDHPTVIGDFCSITHHATVHGAVVEDDCLIGINATIMDGAVIGRGSIVAPGCVVTEGSVIAPNSIVAGIPGKVIKTRDSAGENRLNAWYYWRNAQAFQRGEHREWEGDELKRFIAQKRIEIAENRDR